MNEKLTPWLDRVKGMQYIGERELYVTHAEYLQIRSDFEALADDESIEERVQREERRQRALIDGQRDHFLGTPVVVDDAEAAAQLERIAEGPPQPENTQTRSEK